MSKKKFQEITKLNESEREKRLNELKAELVKSQGNASKKGSTKVKEIKKMIARILTANKQNSVKTEKRKEKK